MSKLHTFMAWKTNGILFIGFCLIMTLFSSNLSAQTNRKKKQHNFSTVGKYNSTIRHGLTFQFSGAISQRKGQANFVPAAAIGYTASQYYGVGNRFMQQSLCYQLGSGIKEENLIHSVLGSFHCSYIGTADLSPFIYGVVLQFSYASQGTYNDAYANFYIRPEIGLAFPSVYRKRSKEVRVVTGSLTYGFNIRTFYNYKPEYDSPDYYGEDIYPWTAMNHHVITLRLNFNLNNMREMKN